MKKWMYLIFPSAMLALFLTFYLTNRKDAVAKEHARAEQKARIDAEAKKQKEINEEKARVAAAERQAQREKEEADKERTRRAKQAAADQKLKDDIALYSGQADKSQKEVSALEIRLDRLRKDQERLNMEAFELAKKVEAAKTAKRNSEMDEERMIEMIVRKTNESSMTRPPALPPALPPPRS
jgi:colicin import membrane protein